MTGYLYILAGLLVFIATGTIANEIRLSRHRGVSREAFIEEFLKQSVPEEIPATVYDYYKLSVVSKRFTVAPDDSLDKVFGEIHEDVDDDASELARRLNMELPTEMVLREWRTPVKTLRDMVLWLDWIRKQTKA